MEIDLSFSKKVAVVLAALLLVSGVFWWHGSSARKNTDAPNAARPALTVLTTTLQAAAWRQNLGANGSVVPWQEAIVGAEVTGVRIFDVKVNVGDQVGRGQILATLAADTLQANAAEAEALLAENEALLADAHANAERMRKLQAAGFVSAQQSGQAVTVEHTARAKLEAQRARYQASVVRLSQRNITAPDAGVISARNATVGAITQPGGELFRLIRQGRLEWHADLMADELGLIHRGMKVELISPQGSAVQGVVRAVSPSINLQTRYGQVQVELPADSGLVAGMFLRGTFMLGKQAKPASVLPQTAVMLRDGVAHVFVVQADSHVKEQEVGVGRRMGEQIEILSGLESGVPVVASGSAFLVSGDSVRVMKAAPASTTAVSDKDTGTSLPGTETR